MFSLSSWSIKLLRFENWNFPRVKKIAKCKHHLLHVSFFSHFHACIGTCSLLALLVSCFLNYSWQRCRGISILFFHIQIFFWFNFRYVAKLFYLKIGKSSNSASLVVQMLFSNRRNQESAGRAHTPDTPHDQPLSCKLEWTNQRHFNCAFAETNQRQSCSRVPQSSWSLSSTYAEELWVEIGERPFSRGVIFTRARVSLALLSLKKNGDYS